MVPTFTVAQGDRRFNVNVNLTPDISTAQWYCGLRGVSVCVCVRGGGQAYDKTTVEMIPNSISFNNDYEDRYYMYN